MTEERIYNPLDKDQLAQSIVREFFRGELHPLPPKAGFTGAGIYALYYAGNFPLYDNVAKSLTRFEKLRAPTEKDQPIPIYIGKSDPPGSRKGLFEEDGEDEAKELLTTRPKHRRLHERLRQHAASISATNNLRLTDFRCRYMLVDEVWFPLGEARLVDWFRPIWNVAVEGFGSKVEGGGRPTTARSVWDILHPGRKEGLGIQVGSSVETKIVTALRDAKTIEQLRTAIKAHRDARRLFAKERKKA